MTTLDEQAATDSADSAPSDPIVTTPDGCKLAQACGTDETRPHLTDGWTERHEDDIWLCASDSYIMVGAKLSIVDPEVSRDLKLGPVPVEVMKALDRVSRPPRVSQNEEGLWEVTEPRGAKLTYRLAPRRLPPPSADALGLWTDPPADRSEWYQGPIGLDSRNITRAAQAVAPGGGWGKGTYFRLEVIHHLRAVKILSTDLRRDDVRAMVMPVRLNV